MADCQEWTRATLGIFKNGLCDDGACSKQTKYLYKRYSIQPKNKNSSIWKIILKGSYKKYMAEIILQSRFLKVFQLKTIFCIPLKGS